MTVVRESDNPTTSGQQLVQTLRAAFPALLTIQHRNTTQEHVQAQPSARNEPRCLMGRADYHVGGPGTALGEGTVE